jgi:hypothetical protein
MIDKLMIINTIINKPADEAVQTFLVQAMQERRDWQASGSDEEIDQVKRYYQSVQDDIS